MRRQPPRSIEAIGLIVLHFSQVRFALPDDDVAGRAGATPAAGVLERNIEILGDVEERLRFAMVRVRQLARLELDCLRLAVDDERDFWHMKRLELIADSCSLTATSSRYSSPREPPGPIGSSGLPRGGASPRSAH